MVSGIAFNDERLKNVTLLSGRSHLSLSNDIAKQLKIDLTPVNLEDFPNGEIGCELQESVRSKDVFVIQTHYGDVSKSIIEQLLLIDAAKRGSAGSITAVCPFLGYSRQDRKSRGREPIGTRLIIDLFKQAGCDRIMSIDMHSGQAQGFFDGPFEHLVAMPLLQKYIKDNFKQDFVIVAPDAGRVKLSERYSKYLNSSLAIIHKTRDYNANRTAEAKHLIGDVKGKDCILIDDMIDTAGTICAAAEILKSKGAKKVFALATHGLFSDIALKRLEESKFDKVIITDTVPVKTNSKKIEVLGSADLIADAINAVVVGGSVSAIFQGQNQF